jgi:hypothetical protein
MPAPTIDFTQLTFPSDSLTVAALRKAYPHSFDLPSRTGGSPSTTPLAYSRARLEDTLGGVIDTERKLGTCPADHVVDGWGIFGLGFIHPRKLR